MYKRVEMIGTLDGVWKMMGTMEEYKTILQDLDRTFSYNFAKQD